MDQPSTGVRRRGRIGLVVLAGIAFLVVLVIALWNWDWFIPLVERQAGATLGRPVTLRHLHVHLGRLTRIEADEVEVAGTAAYPDPLATADHLTALVEIPALIRHRQLVLHLIDIDHPVINAQAHVDGTNNWTLPSQKNTRSSASASPSPILGVLRIEDGAVHVIDEPLKARFDITVSTRDTPDPGQWPAASSAGEIVADARGTYAHQPIIANFVGGAVLSLRDKTRPYPIDLKVANGLTHVALKGTLDEPLAFAGAHLRLLFAGPDMSLLFPLTGVPIPQTPAYSVTGNLDYSKQRIRFRDFEGHVGSSDLGGTIAVLPGKVVDVKADLHSRNVDLDDLGGFLGSKPGNTSAAKRDAEPVRSKSTGVLPNTPINMPKIRAANVDLTYKGDHIENRSVPLDNITAILVIQDGVIDLKKLSFAVGSGTLSASARLDPAGSSLKTDAHADFHRIDLTRLLQATHAFHGQGVIGGRADLQTRGASVAQMLANGDGGINLVMSGGGNISALLPDIAGLEFGNAVLSALGLPNRAEVQCFVMDMPLRSGVLSTKAFLLQTSEARSTGSGTIDFRNQTLDYSLTTRSTHFSVGSLPGPINITGSLASPSIRPGAEVVARAGLAGGLGVLLPPLALLPTIQFGVGEAGACQSALTTLRQNPTLPASRRRRH